MTQPMQDDDHDDSRGKVDRLTKFLLAAACILLFANLIRGENLTNKVENLTSVGGPITQLEEHVNELDPAVADARDAARKASDDLAAAIAESNNSDTIKAFQEMIKAIQRIEVALCNGPCPEPPG